VETSISSMLVIGALIVTVLSFEAATATGNDLTVAVT